MRRFWFEYGGVRHYCVLLRSGYIIVERENESKDYWQYNSFGHLRVKYPGVRLNWQDCPPVGDADCPDPRFCLELL